MIGRRRPQVSCEPDLPSLLKKHGLVLCQRHKHGPGCWIDEGYCHMGLLEGALVPATKEQVAALMADLLLRQP